MKKMLCASLILCLCALYTGALAGAKEITKYQQGQKIDVGFNGDVTFWSGWEFSDGTSFMLVDTDFFEGYLLVDSPRYYYDTIGGGIPIPDGWRAQLDASDEEHCMVITSDGETTIRYHFSFVPAQYEYEQGWKLDRKEVIRDGFLFTALFDTWRVQMSQTAGGKTEQAVVRYEFFHQANNLNFDKLPNSIEEGRRLEKEYPVAAVSPSDPTARVNLREGPGTSYPRCGSLYSGAMLKIREMKDGWALIHAGDTDAYISAEFLTFGVASEEVLDRCKTARVRDGEWIKVSRVPYWGGGGSVTQTRGGQQVRIIGEYNSQWRIVGTESGSYFIHADDVR